MLWRSRGKDEAHEAAETEAEAQAPFTQSKLTPVPTSKIFS
jgi:hypothetical protein